ncbi:efflux RND transporter periplasmic adaptor subunit [Legionella jordanis]|uniref:HlyD family transporter secretion protein n=1 Tax=Legionella jordanis TaxID=456 RepID=A0A0W0V7R4_9GAMM|nr:efflux RND transporter periplasmic adaptor subunit [Legionella jordanis]KTD16160.1 HlyD family transporter secretion protein [Legionella jordanis]RMX04614.1 efflux RND transporter periplasmic adaptor subunit [Legionella jordanis]RMX18323.1 efflux RND transporter periplasmic adaptor subunit [Legionella jordanis]VEH12380.1 HlyD family secretion protein [Legionella jordanis]HAT8713893.1 efflux RND transporter periplasmic adaptor subunit [Legionella jordanis]
MQLLRNFIIVLSIIFLPSCGSAPPAQKATPAEVDVAFPLKKRIIEWDEYTGRFQAVEEVDVRSRVTGYLDAIKFKDGQMVKIGDILFIIDPRPFEYAVTRAQAQYQLATREYQRAVQLQKKSFIAEEAVDRRYQEMKVSETRLNDAKLNLQYTAVKSPITGKISRHYVSVGNLIRKDDTILTKVVSFDPIYFYFEMSQGDLLKYIRLGKTQQQSQHSLNEIVIKLQDEKEFKHKGVMNFTDNVVDRGTGTILGRATIPNNNSLIYPGLFGRARLAGSNEYEALLIPDKAVNSDQSRKFVYAVDKQNKIYRIYVELGPLRDSGFYIIRDGLKGNELIVVNGIQRIHASGQEIKPNRVSLHE